MEDQNYDTTIEGDDFEVFTPDTIEEASEQAQVFDYGENLAGNKEIADKVRDLASRYFDRYRSEHDDMQDKVWKIADFMYRCGRNNALRTAKQTDETRANTGSTLFFRQVRTLASQLVAILNSRPEPYKYVPIYTSNLFSKYEEGKALAEQVNTLDKWTRKNDDWGKKTTEALFQLVKKGNLPVVVMWDRVVAKRMAKRPIRVPNMEGGEEIVGYEFVEEERTVRNQPTLKVWPVEDFYADRTIDNLQDQNCIIMRSIVNYSDLYDGQVSGYFSNVEELDASDVFLGETQNDARVDRAQNLNLPFPDDMQTNNFKRWDVFVRVPIANGQWNEKENKPVWHWCTMVGDDLTSSKVIQVRRNYDPDDEFPGFMWHCLPDDDGELYHMGYAQALESNYEEQTTAKNQAIDNKTLKNRRPLMAVRGEVYTPDLRYEKDKVIFVENQNSLREMQVADIINDNLGITSYLDDDSNRTAGTDKPIVGEPLGGRASATEAQNVFDQASKPHIVLAKYALSDQFLPFVAKKFRKYWEMFAIEDQVVELTGEKGIEQVKPFYLHGDYDIQADVVEEFDTNITKQQNISWMLQTVLPIAGDKLNIQEVAKEVFALSGFKNTQNWFKNDSNVDAEFVARGENQQMQAGSSVMVEEGQDHEAHLRVHKAFKLQWRGLESEAPWMALLDQHIAETEAAIQQAGMAQMMAMMGQMQGAPGQPETVGMASGGEIAAAQGAMANPAGMQ
jgi:hypothetical protein